VQLWLLRWKAACFFAAHQPSNGPNIFTLCVVPFFAFASGINGSLGDVVFCLSMFYFSLSLHFCHICFGLGLSRKNGQ